MKIGDKYNWKDGAERLVYMGKQGNWHQFNKVGEDSVWCEVLDRDMLMLEETVQEPDSREIAWTNDTAGFPVHHSMSVESATAILQKLYTEWPGGLDEIESEILSKNETIMQLTVELSVEVGGSVLTGEPGNDSHTNPANQGC